MRLLLLALLAAAAQPQLGEPVCRRVHIDLPGVWLPDAAWSPDGLLLLASDVGAGRLLRFEDSGARLSDVVAPGSGPKEFNHPGLIYPTKDGFLLRDQGVRLLALDARGQPRGLVATFYPWEAGVTSESALLGDDLVGLGSAHEEDGSRWFGYLRLASAPIRVLARGEAVPPAAAELPYYPALENSVAVASERAYALRYTTPPRIEELFPTKKLSAFPPGFTPLPTIPAGSTLPGRSLEFEAFMSSARLPVKLLGYGPLLYLLTREPAPGGGIRWLLHRIDPVADRLEATLELPSRAPNLLVAPGPRDWALLEKSRASADDRVVLESIVLVPAPWLEQPNSPLRHGGPPVPCAAAGPPRRAAE